MSRIIRNEKKALSVIGKVKCGTKNEKGFPQSLDYFVFTGTYADRITSIVGDKPTQLDIVFIHNNPDLECIERYELRDGKGKILCKGDGLNYEYWDKKEWVKYNLNEHDDYHQQVLDYAVNTGSSGWKTALTLRFAILQFKEVIGLWEFNTHAEMSSIPDIVTAYDFIREGAGRANMIPFQLNVKKHTSQKEYEVNGKTYSPSYTVVSMQAKIGVDDFDKV